MCPSDRVISLKARYKIDLWLNKRDSEGTHSALLTLQDTAMSTFLKFTASTLLTSLLFITGSALAEPDFIGGDLGLPSDQKSNSFLDTSSEAAPPPPPNYSPAEAADKVREKVGGKIINVRTQYNDDGVIYNVKVLNSGRMKTIHVDGQTGQLLNNE